MSSKGKANLSNSTNLLGNVVPFINLSYVGKVGKVKSKHVPIVYPQRRENIEVFARYNSIGRGLIMRKYEGKNTHNLKRGGRKTLQASNLTPHARRLIQGCGDVFQRQTDDGGQSSVMITLTYARNVPTHKESKIHLQNFIRAMKHKKRLKRYVWVAQVQDGQRATEKGIYSYRAEFGECIHFHILTDAVPIQELRHVWCGIVAKWEKSKGYSVSKLGGVDIQKVYNASNYISRYISQESKKGTIIGSMWNVSKELRQEVNIKDTRKIICSTDEWVTFCRSFLSFGKEDITTRDKKTLDKVFIRNDWNKTPIVFTKSCFDILQMFEAYLRNKQKEKIIIEVNNAKLWNVK
jgi:hypothetical protein